MQQYRVKTGENIFDIAVMLSGTIEGIWDLLVSNDWLTLNTTLEDGMILNYHSEYIVNEYMVKWLKENGVKVKNGHHYSKELDIKLFIYDSIVNRNKAMSVQIDSGDDIITSDNSTPISRGSRAPAAPDIDKSRVVGNVQTIFLDNAIKNEYRTINTGNISTAIKEYYSDKPNIAETVAVEEEVLAFWDGICEPKMIIDQYGVTTCIACLIDKYGLVVVDWGDGFNYQAYWYNNGWTYIEHDYLDTGRHIIKIYGLMNFSGLDLSNLNGTYYLISPIFVNGDFIDTPVPNSQLNKLLLIKNHNE